MDFSGVFEGEAAKQGFGTNRLYLRTRDRIHLSLNTVQQYSTSIKPNAAVEFEYGDATRYAIATDLTYDLFISVYDVNTSWCLLARATMPIGVVAFNEIVRRVMKRRNTNIELRVIGLQDNATELCPVISALLKRLHGQLQEVDLFGKEVRHIAFDKKLGMSFNLLLLNRIYSPSELISMQSVEEFSRMRSQLTFV